MSKMKHLKKFESFQINEEEELFFRKFRTGYDTKEEEAEAENKFMQDLEEIEADLKADPEDYLQSKNWEKSKAELLKTGKSNRYRGSLRVQRMGGVNSQLAVVYDPKASGLEAVGAGAAARTANPLGH